MNNEKILLANMDTEECVGIDQITGRLVKALKNSLRDFICYNPDVTIKVLISSSEELNDYFIDYINKTKAHYAK